MIAQKGSDPPSDTPLDEGKKRAARPRVLLPFGGMAMITH